MKMLLAVMMSPCHSNDVSESSLIFAHAWGKFARKNKDKLPCDIMFFNHNHNINRISQILAGLPLHNHMQIEYHSGIAYAVMDHSHNNYDYVILCEHDAFLNVEAINSIYNYLKDNRDVDIVTVSTLRSWFGLQNGQNVDPPMEYVWNIPQTSTALIILNTQLHRDAMVRFKHINANHPVPYNSNSLTYGQICHMLSKPSRQDIHNNLLGLDGPFSVDFWTCINMCNPVPALIVNHDGKSLHCKTWIIGGNQIDHFGTFKNITDLHDQDSADISMIKHKIIAPFLHTGGGYSMARYFSSADVQSIDLVMGFLKDKLINSNISHYAIMEYLTRNSQDHAILNNFINRQQSTMNQLGIDAEHYKQQYNKVINFYKEALIDYI